MNLKEELLSDDSKGQCLKIVIPEIILPIEDQMPLQTAAFKGRAKKLLRQFGKLEP